MGSAMQKKKKLVFPGTASFYYSVTSSTLGWTNKSIPNIYSFSSYHKDERKKPGSLQTKKSSFGRLNKEHWTKMTLAFSRRLHSIYIYTHTHTHTHTTHIHFAMRLDFTGTYYSATAVRKRTQSHHQETWRYSAQHRLLVARQQHSGQLLSVTCQ
jgi:hypothetical protein